MGKARKMGRPQKSNRLAEILTLFIIVTVGPLVVTVSLFTASYLKQSSEPKEPKAAIVDQLSLTYPNQDFVDKAIEILRQAGYTVDYYSGEEVTVDFYHRLSSLGYEMVILRSHSTPVRQKRGVVTLFTSELYSREKYINYLLKQKTTDYLTRVRYSEGDSVTYFGITPYFIESPSIKGRFNKTTIILMGCWGLKWSALPDAFIEKGAKVVIGWDGFVTPNHTDLATENLLRHLLIEKQTVAEAVTQTRDEIGPDLEYGSKLLAYPLDK